MSPARNSGRSALRYGRSTFDIWLDKEERYPVRMEVKVKWGTVKLKLVKRTIKEAAPAHANEGDRDHSGKI